MTEFISQIISYENGELDVQETIDLFQKLVNTGVAWQLQGHYGRTASTLLQEGLITHPEDKNNEG